MKLVTAILFALSVMAAPQDSVIIDKEPYHHLKFENKYVRLFDVSVPSGAATLFHTHPEDYLFVSIGDANLKAQVLGGQPFDLILKNGETRYSKGPLTHRVQNPEKSVFRNVTIEVLGSPGGKSDATPLDKVPHHTLVLDNDKVRVSRLVLEPGQSTGMHTHSLSEVAVVVSGGTIENQESGQQPQRMELATGESRWHGEKRTHSIKNIGRSRVEVVAIELK
ncbi:MAG TPA: hypothetical protein VKM94_12725 [Blastocatellia bacterium]|nr:hypothetical protein [Blastocatellia bacterium]